MYFCLGECVPTRKRAEANVNEGSSMLNDPQPRRRRKILEDGSVIKLGAEATDADADRIVETFNKAVDGIWNGTAIAVHMDTKS
jgi:hypothetical protein